jgi:hypothetical protein
VRPERTSATDASHHAGLSHGGSTVSQYLRQELHGLLESASTEHIPELYAWVKELGGYFKRFNGNMLRPWVNPDVSQEIMDLHARACVSFFQVIGPGPFSQRCRRRSTR